jgi:hypothetical protein
MMELGGYLVGKLKHLKGLLKLGSDSVRRKLELMLLSKEC